MLAPNNKNKCCLIYPNNYINSNAEIISMPNIISIADYSTDHVKNKNTIASLLTSEFTYSHLMLS